MGVGFFEGGAGVGEFLDEVGEDAVFAVVGGEFPGAMGVGEPAAGGVAGDGGGEGFVEVGVVRKVEALMGEFVEEEFGEVARGEVDEGVEDGVGEDAEGRVGIDFGDEDIEASGAELVGESGGVFFFEPAAVGEFAEEGVAPGVGFEGELGGGEDDPDEVLSLEVGVAVVLALGGEVEGVLGVGADFLDELEFGFERGGSGGVGEDLLNGAGFALDFPLAGGGLGVEAGGAALGEQQRQKRQEDERGAGHGRGSQFSVRSW